MKKITRSLLGLSIVAALASGPAMAQTLSSSKPVPVTPSNHSDAGRVADPCKPGDKKHTGNDPNLMDDCAAKNNRIDDKSNDKSEPKTFTPPNPVPSQHAPKS